MIFAGASLSSLPLGAIPNGVDFLVASFAVGAEVQINGRLAKELGLHVESPNGWVNSATRSWSTLALVGRQGATKTASLPREAPVELRLSGWLEGSSVEDARARLDTLKQVLAQTPARVITPDLIYRYVVADVAAIAVEAYGPYARQRTLPIEITLSALDPYRYDLVATEAQAAVAATRVRLPVGTAPVWPVITLRGPATNPVVTLRDYLAASVATMTFGATALLAGDVLVIDCAAGSIAKNGAALLSALTAGDFLRIDPLAIADRERSRWPTLETSSGGIHVLYSRSWL